MLPFAGTSPAERGRAAREVSSPPKNPFKAHCFQAKPVPNVPVMNWRSGAGGQDRPPVPMLDKSFNPSRQSCLNVFNLCLGLYGRTGPPAIDASGKPRPSRRKCNRIVISRQNAYSRLRLGAGLKEGLCANYRRGVQCHERGSRYDPDC
jgi:hypothetical protein